MGAKLPDKGIFQPLQWEAASAHGLEAGSGGGCVGGGRDTLTNPPTALPWASQEKVKEALGWTAQNWDLLLRGLGPAVGCTYTPGGQLSLPKN